MGADGFYRRASGLLVPRLGFASDQPYPCPDCCGEAGPCTCFKVVLSGFVADVCPCTCLNITYYVSAGDGGYGYHAHCNYDSVTSQLVEVDGTWYFRIRMSGYQVAMVWEKAYESEPNVGGFVDEELDPVSSSGQCDNTPTTCLVTCIPDEDPCLYDPGPNCFCSRDSAPSASHPDAWMAELSGFAGSCGGNPCSVIDGEYVLDDYAVVGSACRWSYAGSDPHACFAGVYLETRLSAANNLPSILVRSGTSGSIDWQQEYDYCGVPCDALDEELPRLTAADVGYCGRSSPTCKVTAIYY